MKNSINLFLLGSCLCCQGLFAQAPFPIPADKGLSKQWYHEIYNDNTKTVYKGDKLNTIGMPIGGIAAGQLYIRGDGTLARWWIANNAYNTGFGSPETMTMITPFGNAKNCYQTYTPESYVDQGFKVSIKTASGKKITKQLNKKDFDDVSFIGEYPIAIVNYADKKTPLPVSISMKAFSPFIPLNAKESATPGTYLVFKLKNTSRQKLDVNLAGWLQNMVCQELKDKTSGILRNRAVNNKNGASLVMDMLDDKSITRPVKKETVFDDFEDGLKNWTATGNAFTDNPFKGTVKAHSQWTVTGYSGDYLINSFVNADDGKGKMTSKEFTITDDYINFLIGGGHKPGKIAINLLVDDKILLTETGNDNEMLEPKGWNVSAWKGKKAKLEVVDDATGPWGHINLDRIVFSNVGVTAVDNIETHPYFGNVSLTVLNPKAQILTNIDTRDNTESTKKLGDKLVGEVGVDISLAPGEQREVVFMLTWYFPNRPLDYNGGGWAQALNTRGPAIGDMYSTWYSSSLDVARWMTENRQRLFALTDLIRVFISTIKPIFQISNSYQIRLYIYIVVSKAAKVEL